MSGIPESHLDLFKKKAFAHLATLMPDGNPQTTPVWVDYDGKYVVINTAEGRQKDKNMARDGRVALTLKLVGGLSTEQVARAFLVPVPTMAAR